jgi:hypothetical protein
MTTYIYGLFDPRTDACRYVGKTVKPLSERLRGHVRDAIRRKHSVRRFSWVLSLLAAGVEPVIKELEVVTSGSWQDVEKRWIAKFRANGVDLVNTTYGGDGCTGMIHSEKTKTQMSISARRAQANPELRARIGAAVRKAYQDPIRRARLREILSKTHSSDEYRAKMSAISRGIWNLPERRKQRSEMFKGRKLSAEWRAKISASKTGIARSPESVAKSAAWHRGMKRSPETRARQSAAAKLREARKREAATWQS